MKNIIILIWLIIISQNVSSQNSNVSKILEYSNSLDRSTILKQYDSIYRKNIIDFNRRNYNFQLSPEFYFFKKNYRIVIQTIIDGKDFSNETPESYYGYIKIDSGKYQLIYLRKNCFKAWVYANGGISIEERSDLLKSKNGRHVLFLMNKILRRNPEVILYNKELFMNYGGDFLFIKHDKIYIILFENRRIYELNEYLRKTHFVPSKNFDESLELFD